MPGGIPTSWCSTNPLISPLMWGGSPLGRRIPGLAENWHEYSEIPGTVVYADRMSSRDGAVRTLVVDDHRSYAEALSLALSRADGIESVGAVFSVDQAIGSVLVNRPDVVILDWQLPDVDGIEGVGRIKTLRPSTKIVVISGHAEGIERIALAAGAAAVLPKESSIADIVSTIRRCARGEIVTTSASRFVGDVQPVRLTPRQAEILWMLAKGRDAPQIAAELYISVHTVRGYVKDLRHKLAARSQLEVVAIAREQGLLPA